MAETEAKAAPPVNPVPTEPAPEEIGDWTPQQLAEFCAKVYQQMMSKKEAEAELKQAGRDQILSDALASLKALGERFTATEKELAETKASLLELSDARPPGVNRYKPLACASSNCRSANVTIGCTQLAGVPYG